MTEFICEHCPYNKHHVFKPSLSKKNVEILDLRVFLNSHEFNDKGQYYWEKYSEDVLLTRGGSVYYNASISYVLMFSFYSKDYF